MVPPTRVERSCPHSTFMLQAVDGTQITTYGVCSCNWNIGLRHAFRWVFIIANVKQAILGVDFLHYFGLVVDIRYHALLDSTTHLRVNGSVFWPIFRHHTCSSEPK